MNINKIETNQKNSLLRFNKKFRFIIINKRTEKASVKRSINSATRVGSIGMLSSSFKRNDLTISPAFPGVAVKAKELNHIFASSFKGGLNPNIFKNQCHLRKRIKYPINIRNSPKVISGNKNEIKGKRFSPLLTKFINP